MERSCRKKVSSFQRVGYGCNPLDQGGGLLWWLFGLGFALVGGGLLGAPTASLAEPSTPPFERGIAIDSSGKECAPYWNSTPCMRAELAAGWRGFGGRWNAERGQGEVVWNGRRCLWLGNNYEQCCKELGLHFRGDIQPRESRTGLEKDPNSSCFQLPGDGTDAHTQ